MIYLTKGYIIKKFENRNKALEFIKQDLEQHKLNYMLIYKDVNEDMEVLIYQYHTLYMETYIIHKELNLKDKRSYLYE